MGAKHPLPERVPLPEKNELEHLESLGISFTDLPGVPVKNSDTDQLYVKISLPTGWQFLPTNKDEDKPRYAIVDPKEYIHQRVSGEWIYHNYLRWDPIRYFRGCYGKYTPPTSPTVESALSSNKLGKLLTGLGSEGSTLGAGIVKRLVDSTDDENEKFNYAKSYVGPAVKRK